MNKCGNGRDSEQEYCRKGGNEVKYAVANEEGNYRANECRTKGYAKVNESTAVVLYRRISSLEEV